MANLFGGGGSRSAPSTPPSIDAARTKVESAKKYRGMAGRAAGMLTLGAGQPAVAKRELTGN